MSRAARSLATALLIALLAGATAAAAPATKPAAPAAKPAAPGSGLLPGGNSKEPISIQADKLNYYDKEQKAIYTGNVVVIQGDSQLQCSVMTVFLAKTDAPAAGAANAASPPAADAGASPAGSQVRHMDAAGPVKLVSKTQVATGDKATYDKEENKVWLTGNVTLSDSGNVTKGERMTYDLTTGEATFDKGRVSGIFNQSSGSGDDASKPTSSDKATPAKKDKDKDSGPAAGDKPKPAKKQAAGDAPPKP